ncbi:hypothetical protein GCM10011533_31010 [Streptosporangium jomthongense]|nr:hypothetical protein GCM10011533_31010 [Streptosporangium jomthongense]
MIADCEGRRFARWGDTFVSPPCAADIEFNVTLLSNGVMGEGSPSVEAIELVF